MDDNAEVALGEATEELLPASPALEATPISETEPEPAFEESTEKEKCAADMVAEKRHVFNHSFTESSPSSESSATEPTVRLVVSEMKSRRSDCLRLDIARWHGGAADRSEYGREAEDESK